VYDAITIEEKNKPVVALVNRDFKSVVDSTVSGRGRPGIRVVFETIPLECTVMGDVEAGIAGAFEDIITSLTRPLTAEEQNPKPKEAEKPARIIFKGSFEEVDRFFYRRGWTDGLPVIPPTEAAVAEMLEGTDLPPDHLVAEIVPRNGKATVEKIAINAVMAGALPTYMPVLIAGVQALTDPNSTFGIWGVSTGSWSPFYVINGPVRQDINLNCGSGMFSPGNRPNAAIGRAMGLIAKNIGGIRKAVEDMGCLGNPGKYSLVLGENEEESPWEPLHVEYGFQKEDSTIGVAFPNTYTQMQPYGTDDQSILRTLMYNLLPAVRGGYSLILPPQLAKTLASSGWTKRDVKTFLAQNGRVAAHETGSFWAVRPRGLYKEKVPMIAEDSVPLLIPEMMRILVAGGPGVFIGQLMGSGVVPSQKTIKKIELPKNWESLVKKYKDVVPVYARY
jgi:hypothetical protein